MTLGNMRQLGVHNLVAYCLNDACRHTALIDVSRVALQPAPVALHKRGCIECERRRKQTRDRVARSRRKELFQLMGRSVGSW